MHMRSSRTDRLRTVGRLLCRVQGTAQEVLAAHLILSLDGQDPVSNSKPHQLPDGDHLPLARAAHAWPKRGTT